LEFNLQRKPTRTEDLSTDLKIQILVELVLLVTPKKYAGIISILLAAHMDCTVQLYFDLE